MEKVNHNCGVVVSHNLHDVYAGMKCLQQRGKDAAGIWAKGPEGINVVKWGGRVDAFSLESLANIFKGNFHTFGGHVRYATKGNKNIEDLLKDAHPHAIGGKYEYGPNHVIISDCDAVIIVNGQTEEKYFKKLNQKKFKSNSDSEKLLNFYYENSENELLKEIPGAYFLAIADKRRDETIIIRDKTGIRPGFLGEKDGRYIVASEDIAIIKNGGKPIKDIEPGSIYYFDSDGSYRKRQILEPKKKHCFFEFNYILNRNSTTDRINVRTHRTFLGEKVAQEKFERMKNYNFISYMPESPEIAARELSDRLEIPFLKVFFKRQIEDRAFQSPTMKKREDSIGKNLSLIPGIKNVIEGKRIVMLDDSMVRGVNAKHGRKLLYEDAKVSEALYALYTPPIGIIGEDGVARGCYYGVDMPSGDKFIARTGRKNRTLEEIEQIIKMPVEYLSYESMLEVFSKEGLKPHEICTYCIGGKHPFE